MKLLKKIEESKYIRVVEEAGIYNNNVATALPQTIVAETVLNHFAKGGKKAIIINYDGARADSLLALLPCRNNKIDYSCRYSGITEIAKDGGLYFSFAGGDAVFQGTSTPQGFASILTGKWATENGVFGDETLNPNTKTFLRQLAEKGYKSSFLACWPNHFSNMLKSEITIAKEQGLPLIFKQCPENDDLLQEEVLKAIDTEDIIFSIYESPDYNGHSYLFGNDSYRYIKAIHYCDKAAYELITKIKARPNYAEENWLIIITTDHGGHKWGHGTKDITDRQTFIACNKKII